MNDDGTSYVRSKNGAWHVLISEWHGHAVTSCGLVLRDALVDSLPPSRPRVRPCLLCEWPNGYPRWDT